MSRGVDYLVAAAWAVFGVVVLVASWRIERLENLGINPWSVPGLTPGVVGMLIILLALALAWQARRQAPSPQEAPVPAAASGGWGRTLVAAVLCVLFAGVALGRGLSFVAEGAAFIFIFTTAFSWTQWQAEKRLLRGLATALAVALAASLLISWLFESVFLVRLP